MTAAEVVSLFPSLADLRYRLLDYFNAALSTHGMRGWSPHQDNGGVSDLHPPRSHGGHGGGTE